MRPEDEEDFTPPTPDQLLTLWLAIEQTTPKMRDSLTHPSRYVECGTILDYYLSTRVRTATLIESLNRLRDEMRK